MFVLDHAGDELVNLARYDSVRINGQYNAAGLHGIDGYTYWVEAARPARGKAARKPDKKKCSACNSGVKRDGGMPKEEVSAHLWFGYDEDGAHAFLDRLYVALQARGAVVLVEADRSDSE